MLNAMVLGQGDQTLKAPRPHYQAGRSKHWVKVKNRSHPTIERVKDAFS
jgi:hypothetical protein